MSIFHLVSMKSLSRYVQSVTHGERHLNFHSVLKYYKISHIYCVKVDF